MCSRTPPISAEFRGGEGFEPPSSVRHCCDLLVFRALDNLYPKFGFGFPVWDMSGSLSWHHVFVWILLFGLQCVLFYFTESARFVFVLWPTLLGRYGLAIQVILWIFVLLYFLMYMCLFCSSQWPRGLRRMSAAARLLRLWFRNSLGAWCLSVVSVVCCQGEVSATSWLLVQMSPTDCGTSLCVI